MDSITYLSQVDSFDLFKKEKDFESIHDIENVESLNIENINLSSSYTFSDSDDEFVSDFVNDVVLNSTLQLVKEIRYNSTSIINKTDMNNNLIQRENNKEELLQSEINKKELLQSKINKKELLQSEISKKELLHCETIKKNKSLQTMRENTLCELDEVLNKTQFEIKVKDCRLTINMFQYVDALQETILKYFVISLLVFFLV
ncbi:uncharacterized lipoprotein MCAP_0231 [Hydra vulgaris]|uniref:uncharacterized lipoprotein MCAP_0231 n=1 Tax=Hydra vulgaris TaxID=6087 RepID=UPI001F5F369E|nr:uncharacterized lipoprotein MCAP_0231-like [Hydra vulgaris]